MWFRWSAYFGCSCPQNFPRGPHGCLNGLLIPSKDASMSLEIFVIPRL